MLATTRMTAMFHSTRKNAPRVPDPAHKQKSPSWTGPVISRSWLGLHRAAALHDASIVFVLAFHGITPTGYTRLVGLPAGKIAGLDRSGHATDPLQANANTAPAITFLKVRIDITP